MNSSEILKLANYINVSKSVREVWCKALAFYVNVLIIIITIITFFVYMFFTKKYFFISFGVCLLIQILLTPYILSGLWITNRTREKHFEYVENIFNTLQFPVAYEEDDKYIQQIYYDSNLTYCTEAPFLPYSNRRKRKNLLSIFIKWIF